MGSYKGTLHDLCQIADQVVEDMKSYNLVTSNCQHFCNNLLRKTGKRNFRITVGRMEKEKKFDYYMPTLFQVMFSLRGQTLVYVQTLRTKTRD